MAPVPKAVLASGDRPTGKTQSFEPSHPDEAILEHIRVLQSITSMPVLRAKVAALKQLLHSNGVGWDACEAEFLLARLDQIVASRTLERARYYLTRLERSLRQVRTNGVNDINLNRWQEYTDILTDSLWLIERRDNSGVHSAEYWGNFIPQIPYQMMRRYTRRGEWVLDTFAGAGTTLIEGQRLGRHTIGIELNPVVAEQARRLIAAEPNPYHTVADVIIADSCALDYHALLAQYGQRSVQLIIMHPPYFDIIKFSDDPRDLSNARSVEAFLERLGQVVGRVVEVLDPGRYLVLVIGDKYAAGEWIPLGFRAMQVVFEAGLALKSIIVKNFEQTTAKRTQKALWRYRALSGGFYVFKHEYIFVFYKRAAHKNGRLRNETS
ncbi:MAG: DNA methyltransferase [Anaerolineae bacterium]|nr:DNA methyltransferase [Anaerolineae bacterium]MDW8070554.1 DNA methyltransferase [Anaerolineae bacterium]